MSALSQSERDGLTYAFGHMVSSFIPEDAHHADSAELADDTLRELGYDEDMIEAISVLAEHVNGNYRYTGEADDIRRRIQNGEL